MNKFEQLIEYVINDEEAKAKELFHDIVVEKSRQIYEEMMEEEAEEQEESVEEAKEEQEESIEEAREEEEESVEEGMEEAHMGGDQTDDLIDDVETEEQGMAEGGDDDMEDAADEAELEDRVVDLEDKLDELMAEFESLMGDEAGEEEHADMDMDVEVTGDDGMTDLEVADDELETEGMMEAVTLKAAPAPVKSEEGNINKKAVYAANSGQKGMAATPKDLNQGGEAQGRPAPGTKDLIGKVQNTPAQSTVKQAPATKPHLAQATGVNVKSPLPRQ